MIQDLTVTVKVLARRKILNVCLGVALDIESKYRRLTMAKISDEQYIAVAVQGVADAEKEGDIPRQPYRVVAQLHTQVNKLLAEVLETAMAWSEDVEKLGTKIDKLTEHSIITEDKSQRLRTALHDAINRPMGVVPESAEEFYRNGTRSPGCDEKEV